MQEATEAQCLQPPLLIYLLRPPHSLAGYPATSSGLSLGLVGPGRSRASGEWLCSSSSSSSSRRRRGGGTSRPKAGHCSLFWHYHCFFTPRLCVCVTTKRKVAALPAWCGCCRCWWGGCEDPACNTLGSQEAGGERPAGGWPVMALCQAFTLTSVKSCLSLLMCFSLESVVGGLPIFLMYLSEEFV